MGYIYLLHISNNIYKIGRTDQQLHNRISKYKNNPTLVLGIRVLNEQFIEQMCIKIFTDEFKLCQGREYFIGCPNTMVKIINNSICEYSDQTTHHIATNIFFAKHIISKSYIKRIIINKIENNIYYGKLLFKNEDLWYPVDNNETLSGWLKHITEYTFSPEIINILAKEYYKPGKMKNSSSFDII